MSLYRQHDTALEAVLATILGIAQAPSAAPGPSSQPLFDGYVQRQIHLPISRGGIGLVSLEQQAPVAYVGAWHLAAPLVHATFGRAAGSQLVSALTFSTQRCFPFQHALVAAHARLPATVQDALPAFSDGAILLPGGGPTKLGHLLADDHFQALLQMLPTPAAKARLRSTAGPAAGAWLTALPLHSSLLLQPAHFVVAVRLRLGLTQTCLQGLPLCACGTVLHADGGLHVLRCPTGGGLTLVHNAVRNQVALFTREAGYVTRIEPIGTMPLRTGERQGASARHCLL